MAPTPDFTANSELRREAIAYLSRFAYERRVALFNRIVQGRTRYVTVLLEDIYQSQNASAVLRTCDCMGVQDVYVVENRNRFSVDSEVDMGASKWLCLNRFNAQHPGTSNTRDALLTLKRKGYRLVATTPHRNDVTLSELPLEPGPVALLFGTELTGLSQTALELADEYVRIPMYGFTESYNISVSVALTLYDIVHRLRNSNIDYTLSETERELVILEWLKSSVRNSDLLIDRFIAEYCKKV